MARLRFDRDYYRLLGLPPEAADDEIRRAYRRLALRWHPDRNSGDPQAAERFKETSEAYAVLIDPAKRREYDAARRAGATGEFRQTREDLFRDLFADPRASAVFEELAREFARMGMRVDQHSFHQTLFGGRTVVTGGVVIISPLTPALALLRLARAAVRGARASPAAQAPAARLGELRPGLLGGLATFGRWLLGLPAAPASAERGLAAHDLVQPLRLTRDEAERGARKRVTLGRDGGGDEVLVTIPAGIRDGTRLRLRGKGRAGPGGARGDLYLAVEVTERG
jgi:curved DNA-binding protein CbpA